MSAGYAMKYFAVSYGFGEAFLSGDNVINAMSTSTNSDGSLSYSGYRTTLQEYKRKFIMRPNIRGFIPCGNGYGIALSLSYLWVPSYKQMNSFEFGVGINVPFND